MGFIRVYVNTAVGSWLGRVLLGIPTVAGVGIAILVSSNPWMWIALVLLGITLIQGYAAYEKWWSPLQEAIHAIREEIGEIEAQLDRAGGKEGIPKPILPATYWNRHRDFLRGKLETETYKSVHEAFAAINNYNLTGSGLKELRRKLKAADKALDPA